MYVDTVWGAKCRKQTKACEVVVVKVHILVRTSSLRCSICFVVNTDCIKRLSMFAIIFVQKVWHEIARPQIHGYDIQCVALIDR